MNTPRRTTSSALFGRGRTQRAAPGQAVLTLAECGYVAFLLLVFVGVTPFAAADMGAQADAEAGAGDALRQISYLLAFGTIGTAAFLRHGWRCIEAFPPLLAMLLGLCLVSAGWSLDPSVSFRRGVLLCVVAASVTLSVKSVGPARALQLLCYVLAGVVAVDLLSIALVPQAKHLADGIEPQLAGDWRGVHGHKNLAGALYADIILIALFLVAATRHRGAVLLAAASAVFLIGTNSKSSLGLLPLAALAGVAYHLAMRSSLQRRRIAVGAALAAALALAALCMWWEPVLKALHNPDLFTGRIAIWQAEWAYIADHPLIGSGFGSFAYTGKSSPLADYIGSAWTGTVANGHQGYLELLVTLGMPGLLLALTALLVAPLRHFAGPSRFTLPARALLFSLFVFFFLHNFMESDFLKTDDPEWVMFLLTLALLRGARVPAVAPA